MGNAKMNPLMTNQETEVKKYIPNEFEPNGLDF